MTNSTLSPAYTDVTNPQREHYLQPAVAGRENPFKNFDWGGHLITWPQLTNQDAEPGTIASSNPSDLPSKLIWSTSLPLKKVWGTIIIFEVSKLAEEYNFRYTLISSYEIARGEEGTEFDVISVGIDVSEPVVKADAEEFVKRCSEMLATHHLEDTIDQVSHSRFWGNLAPQRRR